MQRFALLFLFTFCTLLATALWHPTEAKRLGGGRSIGRVSTPHKYTSPQTAPRSAPERQTPQNPSRASGWWGPVAGLAAGLGLATLASHFGLGPAFSDILLIMGFVALIFLIKRMIGQRQNLDKLRPATAEPSALPRKVFEKVLPTSSTMQAPQFISLEEEAAFLSAAKERFMALQKAGDEADFQTLEELTSPNMYSILKSEIESRKDAENCTEVVTLKASICGFESSPPLQCVSVEFSGLIRETAAGEAAPFLEIWTLVRPEDKSHGWLLDGIEQPPEAAMQA